MAENSPSPSWWLMTNSSFEWLQQASLLGEPSGTKMEAAAVCWKKRPVQPRPIWKTMLIWNNRDLISGNRTGDIQLNTRGTDKIWSVWVCFHQRKVLFLEMALLMLHFQQLDVKEIPFLKIREKNVMSRLRYTDRDFPWQFYHTPMC